MEQPDNIEIDPAPEQQPVVPLTPAPPPPFTVYGVIPAETGWRIEWLSGDGKTVTSTVPIVGWMFGQRQTDNAHVVVPLTPIQAVFYSIQTQAYRFVGPSGIFINPSTVGLP